MIATTAPPSTTLPAFAWLTDKGQVAVSVRQVSWTWLRTVQARRSIELGAAEAAELQRLCDAARGEE